MEVKTKKRFLNQFDSLKNIDLKEDVLSSLILLEEAESIEDAPFCKKMIGFKNYYRLRVDLYRIGVEVHNKTAIIMCVMHRSEIYSHFPKFRKPMI